MTRLTRSTIERAIAAALLTAPFDVLADLADGIRAANFDDADACTVAVAVVAALPDAIDVEAGPVEAAVPGWPAVTIDARDAALTEATINLLTAAGWTAGRILDAGSHRHGGRVAALPHLLDQLEEEVERAELRARLIALADSLEHRGGPARVRSALVGVR